MTVKELQERQKWSIEQKIDHSLYVIEAYLKHFSNRCFVSFSGGKDSTVLLDLVRVVNKKIPAVFVNTGNEWPDIVRFVRYLKEKPGYNIVEVHPKKTPLQVWAECGFPLISKETAMKLWYMKHKPDSTTAKTGWGDSIYSVPKKWRFLASERFDVASKCCSILKENPLGCYARQAIRVPIVGTLAEESLQRTTSYVKRGGCNTFGDNAMSLPLSIWTEKDIWKYIEMRDLEISDIYRKGAKRTGCVGCGFGCQFADDTRFDLLHELYPKYYDMIMAYESNGVQYRDVVRKIFEMNGKKLPDE